MIYLLLCLILFVLYNFFQISVYKIYNLDLHTNKIQEEVNIIHISDFHNNKYIDMKKLKKDLELINPDYIFITGDLISRNTKNFKILKEFLSIISKFDVVFVEGNHEVELKSNKFKEIFYDKLNYYKIKNLSNKTMCYSDLNIYGAKYNEKFEINKNFNNKKFNILLSHDLNKVIDIKQKYDLVLSGHTHGGQIRFPFIGQIIDHNCRLLPKYSKGEYNIENTAVYISSGLGQTIPIRILNRVSITHIKINPS